MTITVFGASGKVGRLMVAEALRRGLNVRAFVHSQNPFDDTAGLTVIRGDIYRGDDIAKALDGADAVVSCLGSWGTPRRNVLTAAMRSIIPAMQQLGITRIITLTGSGALAPDKRPSALHRLFMRLLAPLPAGKVFADGEQHMKLLAASDLAWTTVRSPVMRSGIDPQYELAGSGGAPIPRVNRSAVVAAMLDQLASRDWLRQAPVIRSNGHTV